MLLHLLEKNMNREDYLIKTRAIELLGQSGLGNVNVPDSVWYAMCALAKSQLKQEGKL